MNVAIVGCGQLAQMLAMAGLPLGVKFSFLADMTADTRCVDGLGTVVRHNPSVPADSLFGQLGHPEVMTFENEQTPIEPIKPFEKLCRLAPGLNALYHCQHRHREKQLLEKLGILNAPFQFAQSLGAVKSAIETLGLPCIAKSVDQGYDGKNQWQLKTPGDANDIPETMLAQGLIVEKRIDFLREVSLVGVRAADGEIRFYPPTENVHERGILIQSVAPAQGLSETQISTLEHDLGKILDHLDYVGVMAMECFVTEHALLVNELAPRVHNSGHWTQDGVDASQFENHIRAITGQPLGSTEPKHFAGMVNILGPNTPEHLNLPDNATLHWYKKTVRPGRKLGHVNVVAASIETLKVSMATLREQLIEHP